MKYTFLVIPFLLSSMMSCTPNKSITEVDNQNDPQSETVKSNLLDVYIGTYTTEEGSKGIYKVPLDTSIGEFGEIQLVAQTVSPSFIALSKDKSRLYAVNEIVPDGYISTFVQNSGNWEETSKLTSLGDAPCHIILNKDQSIIAVANYVTGNVTTYPLDEAGNFVDKASTGQHTGKGPNEARQEAPHAHFVQFSKNQKFLYAVDLGIDEIKTYSVSENGISEAKTAIKLNPGDGPRHFVFHPTLDIAYVINELSNTVSAVQVDPISGGMREFDRVTTLPEDFTEHSQCADIHISSDGKFLYASNRGHNSIAVYEISDDGKLTLKDITSVDGNWPRNFMLTPSETHLLVANERSDNIVLFDRDPNTGLISYSGKQVSVSKPVCLVN